MDRIAEQALDHPPLAVAKGLFTMQAENIGNRTACCSLDLAVRVDERQAEMAGKPLTDAAFAGTHQADEHDRSRDVRKDILPEALVEAPVA